MVHIVQVVLLGNVETPKAYSDEGAARAAYVECVKKCWANSYGAYCQARGADGECFSTARDFMASLDLADRSRVHYWSIPSGDGGESVPPGLSKGLEALKEGVERLDLLARELDVVSASVRAGVSGVRETIAGLSGEVTAVSACRGDEAEVPGRLDVPAELTSPSSAAPTHLPAERYDTREWKEYVETIRNMCGGNRSEYHLFTRSDWRQAVYGNRTDLEYWDWVAATIDRHIERAQQAGYHVIADQEKPGCYRFITPDGMVGDISSGAEGEAWCLAGLHLDGT